MNAGFVGTWLCQYYDAGLGVVVPTPPFPMTITQECAHILNGSYPIPGGQATLRGNLTNDGRVWSGTFKGLIGGTFAFVLSEKQDSFHGAWIQGGMGGPPQPEWGYRQK